MADPEDFDYNKALNDTLTAAGFAPSPFVHHSSVSAPIATWRRGDYVVTIDNEGFWLIDTIDKVNDEDTVGINGDFDHVKLAEALAKLPA